MVTCPRVAGAEVDIERCLACSLLERLGSTNGEEWITCRAATRRSDPYFGSIPS
jgi:hypothetical protein